MIVYRLVRANRALLDGKGAALFAGRWNNENIPCIYTSTSSSLAQLELMANHEDWKIFTYVPHVMLQLTVPNRKIKLVHESNLPHDWNRAMPNALTQQFGTNLLNNFSLLGFSVPSTVNNLERNVILNPRAVSFAELVTIKHQFPFEMDARLVR